MQDKILVPIVVTCIAWWCMWMSNLPGNH